MGAAKRARPPKAASCCDRLAPSLTHIDNHNTHFHPEIRLQQTAAVQVGKGARCWWQNLVLEPSGVGIVGLAGGQRATAKCITGTVARADLKGFARATGPCLKWLLRTHCTVGRYGKRAKAPFLSRQERALQALLGEGKPPQGASQVWDPPIDTRGLQPASNGSQNRTLRRPGERTQPRSRALRSRPWGPCWRAASPR
jgi:hypothetical protein